MVKKITNEELVNAALANIETEQDFIEVKGLLFVASRLSEQISQMLTPSEGRDAIRAIKKMNVHDNIKSAQIDIIKSNTFTKKERKEWIDMRWMGIRMCH